MRRRRYAEEATVGVTLDRADLRDGRGLDRSVDVREHPLRILVAHRGHEPVGVDAEHHVLASRRVGSSGSPCRSRRPRRRCSARSRPHRTLRARRRHRRAARPTRRERTRWNVIIGLRAARGSLEARARSLEALDRGSGSSGVIAMRPFGNSSTVSTSQLLAVRADADSSSAWVMRTFAARFVTTPPPRARGCLPRSRSTRLRTIANANAKLATNSVNAPIHAPVTSRRRR